MTETDKVEHVSDSRIPALEAESAESRHTLNLLNDRISNFEQNLAKVELDRRDEISSLQREVSTRDVTIDRVTRKVEKVEADLQNSLDQNARLTQLIKRLKAEKADLESKCSDLEKAQIIQINRETNTSLSPPVTGKVTDRCHIWRNLNLKALYDVIIRKLGLRVRVGKLIRPFMT